MADIIEQAEKIVAEHLLKEAQKRVEELREIEKQEGNVY